MKERKRRTTRSREQAPGWLWMLFGLSLGLLIALGVYLRGSNTRLDLEAPAAELTSPEVMNQGAEREAPLSNRAARAPAPRTDSPDTRFEFYDILPQSEVVIPEVETPQPAAPRPIDESGNYILQAGSFTSIDDADRLQATLALLGVESRIQRVMIDEDVFHRVRVGPISDPNELNRLRQQLRDASIEPLLMKVP